MPTQIALSFEDSIARIRLEPEGNRPPVLEQTTLGKFEEAIETIEQKGPRAVIVESTSDRFFCLGADLKILRETTEDSIGPWVREGHRVLNRFEDLPCPTIARVGGYAMGGGLEIAMACDLIYVEDTAKFGQSEASIGFIPGWGGTLRLVERIGMSKAKRYFFTGDIIDAQTAVEIGLAEFCGDKASVTEEIDRVAAAISKNSRYALATFKSIVQNQRFEKREANSEIEADFSRACTIDPDTRSRITAFFNRKK